MTCDKSQKILQSKILKNVMYRHNYLETAVRIFLIARTLRRGAILRMLPTYITLHTFSHFFGKKEPFLRFVSQEKKLTTPGCGRFFAIFQWKKVLITLEKFILIDASRIYALGKLIKKNNVSENSSFLCFASFWKIHNINLK